MIRRNRLPRAVLILLLAAPAARAEGPWPRALDSALEAVGLTPAAARFEPSAVAQWGGDRYVNPRFVRVFEDPWLLPQTIARESEAVARAGGSLFELLRLATLRTGEGVYRGLIGKPLEAHRERIDGTAEPFLDALKRLYEGTQTRWVPSQDASFRKEAEKLTPAAQRLLAYFTHACADWLGWRKLALRRISSGDGGLGRYLRLGESGLEQIFRSQTRAGGIDSLDAAQVAQLHDFLEAIDLPYLYTGGLDLAAVTEFVADSAARLGRLSRGDFVWDTPLGRIAVSDTAANVYQAGRKYLLILDAGGDDVYHAGGASTNEFYHTGVIIDLAGHDSYRADTAAAAAFGGGVLGLGFVLDLAGDDRYDAGSQSLGAGIFGMGGLLDRGGRDEYRGYVNSQGVGLYGVGVLADLAGDDRYYGFQQIQGFGFTRGCGILFDRAGNDVYVADDSILHFPSSQTREHNASLAQGVGFGLRADYLHGHSLAGGLGYLVDLEGNDRYRAGLFAQGCAYWYAFGMLADGGGDDAYEGVWYVQGSGAHFAVGALHDRSGNDRYTATMNMAQGAGHDFTVGLLWDAAGDDVYRAPNLSLGAGNANGIGIFRDDAGNDTYAVSAATTLGRANSSEPATLRFDLLCLGLFLDLGGDDTYPADKTFARDGARWTQPPVQEPASPRALGVGLDTGP